MTATEAGGVPVGYPRNPPLIRELTPPLPARSSLPKSVLSLVVAGLLLAAPAVVRSEGLREAAPGDRTDPVTAFGALPSARAVVVDVAAAQAASGDAASDDPAQRGEGGTVATLPPLPRRSPIFVPQWELGIGISTLALPDYRGSDRTRYYGLPFPYATWRSERFTADRSGLKAELLDRGRLEIDMSLAASVPVSSRGNEARAGMPRLHPTLEVGPQLVANLWRSSEGSRSLRAQFPLRYVFTVSRDMHDAGLTFNPRLVFDVQNVAGYHGWNLGVVGGPMFGSRRHHDFYYSVDSAYASSDRPVYRASGGFGGVQLTLALSKRFTHHWFGGFIRADWLDGATFEDSPLVRRRQSVAAGVAFSWILSQSDKRVPLAR